MNFDAFDSAAFDSAEFFKLVDRVVDLSNNVSHRLVFQVGLQVLDKKRTGGIDYNIFLSFFKGVSGSVKTQCFSTRMFFNQCFMTLS